MAQKRNYILTAIYYEYCSELVTKRVEQTTKTPFEILLDFTQEQCKTSTTNGDWVPIPRHSAALYLSDGGWDCAMWVYDDGEAPQSIGWREMQYPWQQISDLKSQINKLEEALKTYENLSVLGTVPGFDENQITLQIEPIKTHIATLKGDLTAKEQEWSRITADPAQGKPLRSVQVD